MESRHQCCSLGITRTQAVSRPTTPRRGREARGVRGGRWNTHTKESETQCHRRTAVGGSGSQDLPQRSRRRLPAVVTYWRRLRVAPGLSLPRRGLCLLSEDLGQAHFLTRWGESGFGREGQFLHQPVPCYRLLGSEAHQQLGPGAPEPQQAEQAQSLQLGLSRMKDVRAVSLHLAHTGRAFDFNLK